MLLKPSDISLLELAYVMYTLVQTNLDLEHSSILELLDHLPQVILNNATLLTNAWLAKMLLDYPLLLCQLCRMCMLRRFFIRFKSS